MEIYYIKYQKWQPLVSMEQQTKGTRLKNKKKGLLETNKPAHQMII